MIKLGVPMIYNLLLLESIRKQGTLIGIGSPDSVKVIRQALNKVVLSWQDRRGLEQLRLKRTGNGPVTYLSQMHLGLIKCLSKKFYFIIFVINNTSYLCNCHLILVYILLLKSGDRRSILRIERRWSSLVYKGLNLLLQLGIGR